MKGLEGREGVSVIVDDSMSVWAKHSANLLEVERYHYFPSSARSFGARGRTYLEQKRCGLQSITIHTSTGEQHHQRNCIQSHAFDAFAHLAVPLTYLHVKQCSSHNRAGSRLPRAMQKERFTCGVSYSSVILQWMLYVMYHTAQLTLREGMK
jgi:hypothetical protein